MAASVAKGKPPARLVPGAWRQALSTGVPAAETGTHFASLHSPPPPPHRGAAASLLDQSELHGGFRCQRQTTCKTSAWCLAASTLHRSASGRDGHALCEFAFASASHHRGAAASLLDQSELHGGFRCQRQTRNLQVPHAWCPVPGGKHSVFNHFIFASASDAPWSSRKLARSVGAPLLLPLPKAKANHN